MLLQNRDARERVRVLLNDYVARHASTVGDGMLAQWNAWMDDCWQRTSSTQGDEIFREPEAEPERSRLASKYLRGEGLEIGALYNPLPLPAGARARYVDKADLELLRLLYYEVSQFRIVDADIVDDGRTLTKVDDESVDFVISNHFLEHCDDPIGTLVNHVRVLRPGGFLYLAIPDCRKTFDAPREITTLKHLWRDYDEGPDWSRAAHYREWATLVNERTGDDFEAWWRLLDAVDFSIHFHVWRPVDVLELLLDVRGRLNLPLDVREFVQHANECVAILEKRA